MPDVERDLDLVFLGLIGASSYRVFGVTTGGEVIEVFDPSTALIVDDAVGTMTLGKTNFAVVGDDLHFTWMQTEFDAETGRFSHVNTMVSRLSDDGELDDIAQITRFEPLGRVGDRFIPLATEFSDLYALPLIASGSGAVGQTDGDIYGVGSAGTLTRLSNLFREGASPDPGLAALGGELYYAADMRSPLGSGWLAELWRRNPDGSNEFLFEDPQGHVSDVQSFAGSVWFTVEYFPVTGIRTPGFYRVDPTGDPVAVDLSAAGPFSYAYLRMKVVNDRLFVFTPFGDLFEVMADGTLVRSIADGAMNDLRDFAFLGDTLYAVGGAPGDYFGTLYRVLEDGTVLKVPDAPKGVGPNSTKRLTEAGDKLYFVSNDVVDDGFGGLEDTGPQLFAMAADGTITRLTGPGTDHPLIRDAGDLFAFDLDILREIIGTAAADRLVGGNDAETILGRAGNDTILGQGGDDSLEGGHGEDRILGGDGADTLSGGRDADTMYGGRGDDLVVAGSGVDWLDGAGGNDTLVGGTGRDALFGGEGADILRGGDGNDTLRGDAGRDRLTGDAGADRFLFGTADGRDRITDFEPGLDRIGFDGVDALSGITFIARADGVRLRVGETTVTVEGVTLAQIEDAANFLF